MKQQRRTAEDNKEHLLVMMREIHAQVTSQSEFTAQRIADAAGISKVWLYHIAGDEFRLYAPGSQVLVKHEMKKWRRYDRKTLICVHNSKRRRSKLTLLLRLRSKKRW